MKVEIHQIYYNEQSKQGCYKWTNHYYNNPDNKFDMALFENFVIQKIVSETKLSDDDYIGVLSHAFRALNSRNAILGKVAHPFNLQSLEKLFSSNSVDVLSFYASNKTKNIIRQSESSHAKSPFIKALKLLFERANIKFDVINPKPHRFYIMRNAWLANVGTYKRYLDEMLNPCISAMRNEEDTELQNLIWQSANYSMERLRFQQNPKLKQFFAHYPLHPFLLERLPSVWLTMNPEIKCLHW